MSHVATTALLPLGKALLRELKAAADESEEFDLAEAVEVQND